MSDTNPMEQAGGQAAQTAAVALQVLVMVAQALRERQQREAAEHAAAPTPTSIPARQPADPDHERYGHLVRGTVKPAEVAEAMVSSAQWPQLASELKRLEAAGVNVAQFLGDAAPVIARMDSDLRAGSTTPGVTVPTTTSQLRNPWAPPPGQESGRNKEPRAGIGERMKEGGKHLLDKVRGQKPVLDRASELARLGIGQQENARLVIVARESLADEHVLGRLVTSREWPTIAKQMKDLHASGHNPREALAGVPVRIQQAAAAGITLTPAEAARGLLGDQAKTPPTPAPTATPTPTAAPATLAPARTSTAASTSTQAATPTGSLTPTADARASAASARSTTATSGVTPPSGPTAEPVSPSAQPTPARTHGR